MKLHIKKILKENVGIHNFINNIYRKKFELCGNRQKKKTMSDLLMNGCTHKMWQNLSDIYISKLLHHFLLVFIRKGLEK